MISAPAACDINPAELIAQPFTSVLAFSVKAMGWFKVPASQCISVFVTPATNAWAPSWIKKADTMPAENFRVPNASPSSEALAQDGANPKKNRAAAPIIVLSILEILLFSTAVSATEKNQMLHHR